MSNNPALDRDIEAVKRAADAQRPVSLARAETRPMTPPADPLPGEVCTCDSLADLDPNCPTHGTARALTAEYGDPPAVDWQADNRSLSQKIADAPLFTHTEGAPACTCPGDPSASAAGWNAACPLHGETEVVARFDKTTEALADEAEQGYDIHPAWLDPDHPDAPRYTHVEIGTAAPRHAAEPVTTGHYAAQVCQHAIELFTGPRNADYGDATDNFTDIADLWTVVLRPILQPGATITAEQVAIMSALIKVARLNNTPDHDDSWIDATAYLALGAGINRRRT